jgi:hypothetical protein
MLSFVVVVFEGLRRRGQLLSLFADNNKSISGKQN